MANFSYEEATGAFVADGQVNQDHALYTATATVTGQPIKLELKRAAPKPTSLYSGQHRRSFKITVPLALDPEVAVTPTGNMIAEVNLSFPVGCSSTVPPALLDAIGTALADTGSTSLRAALGTTGNIHVLP